MRTDGARANRAATAAKSVDPQTVEHEGEPLTGTPTEVITLDVPHMNVEQLQHEVVSLQRRRRD